MKKICLGIIFCMPSILSLASSSKVVEVNNTCAIYAAISLDMAVKWPKCKGQIHSHSFNDPETWKVSVNHNCRYTFSGVPLKNTVTVPSGKGTYIINLVTANSILCKASGHWQSKNLA